MFVDSHCHLNYLDDPAQALRSAVQAQVSSCLCIGVEQKSISEVRHFALNNPGVWWSVGEHPGSCSGDARWIENYVGQEKLVALGEMGLDYLYEESPVKQEMQRETFNQQMVLASQTNLPVIIHTRGAEQDTLKIICEHNNVNGVLHCFTESWQMAQQAIEVGYYVSISGIVTFRNADNVRDVARQIPLYRLLIETDAPWLSPVPYRGKQNQPAYVSETADFLAQLRGISVEELAETTKNNFYALFSQADDNQTLTIT